MKKYRYLLVFTFLFVFLAANSANAGSLSYTYDNLNRLIGVEYSNGTKIEYSYDQVGNRIIANVIRSSAPKAGFTAEPTSGSPPLAMLLS